MAHTYTRLEGFELGSFLSLNGDANTLCTVGSTIKRSGNYSLRVNNNGSSAAFARLSVSFDDTAKASTTALFVACSYRFYIYIDALPSAISEIAALETKTPGFSNRSLLKLGTTGILTLESTLGTTVLTTGEWHEISVVYNSASSGSVSLRINGVQEFSGVVPSSNGTVGTLRLGKTSSPNSYDIYFDDIAIEAAASVSSIDYPLPGKVLPVLADSDGHYDGVWAVVGASNAYQAVPPPEDGLTSSVGISGTGNNRRQTFGFETAEEAGLGSNIRAVQFSATSRSTNAAPVAITTWNGSTFVNLTTQTSPTAGVNFNAYLAQNHPHTSTTWTAAQFATLDAGVVGSPSVSGILRVSSFFLMVDVQTVEAGVGVNTTYLQQVEFLTGLLNSFTEYSPHLRSVQITSEAFGESNKAFNIVACSVRYVPNGNEVVRGAWFFDKNATSGFTLDSNPLERSLIAPAATSTFTFGSSTLLDNREVYTQYIQMGGSGKFFQLDFTQTGSRKMNILALEFEVKIEGRREAYLYGNY